MLRYEIRYLDGKDNYPHKDVWAVLVYEEDMLSPMIYRTMEQITHPAWQRSCAFESQEQAKELRELLAVARDELKDRGILPH